MLVIVDNRYMNIMLVRDNVVLLVVTVSWCFSYQSCHCVTVSWCFSYQSCHCANVSVCCYGELIVTDRSVVTLNTEWT